MGVILERDGALFAHTQLAYFYSILAPSLVQSQPKFVCAWPAAGLCLLWCPPVGHCRTPMGWNLGVMCAAKTPRQSVLVEKTYSLENQRVRMKNRLIY